MRPYRIRGDLERAVLDGFALPLGLVPDGITAPRQGYTVDFVPGEEDEPDGYAFYVVVSHEKVKALVRRAFALMPAEVYGIVEVGSRDAYRSLDVFVGREPLPKREYLEGWKEFEPFLLEDGSIGAGANGEEPFVEVFLDQWKGLSIHVPLLMRERVEAMLAEFELEEVGETWPEPADEGDLDADGFDVRPVLVLEDEYSPSLDEMLLQLRQAWDLELNVDPDTNVDVDGRDIGPTLWHAMVIVEPTEPQRASAYASIWATAGSLSEMHDLIDQALAATPEWRFDEIYTIDRVAFDERPDELSNLAPQRSEPQVHLVVFDT
jgi:hypothetical protein